METVHLLAISLLTISQCIVFTISNGNTRNGVVKITGYKDELRFPQDCHSSRVLEWVGKVHMCYTVRNERPPFAKILSYESDDAVTSLSFGFIRKGLCKGVFDSLNTFCVFD